MTTPLLLQASIGVLKDRLRGRESHVKLLPEFKVELLKELRSGQYRRTTGKLIDCEGACCLLGVVAKVMEKRGLVKIEPAAEWRQLSAMFVSDIDSGYSESESIPQRAADRIGLTSYCQDILSSFNDSTPVADNDTLFAEAANLIEEYL